MDFLSDTEDLGKIAICKVSKNKFNKIKFHAGLMTDWSKYRDAVILIVLPVKDIESEKIKNETS